MCMDSNNINNTYFNNNKIGFPQNVFTESVNSCKSLLIELNENLNSSYNHTILRARLDNFLFYNRS